VFSRSEFHELPRPLAWKGSATTPRMVAEVDNPVYERLRNTMQAPKDAPCSRLSAVRFLALQVTSPAVSHCAPCRLPRGSNIKYIVFSA
jgi:hypothetical protein